MQEPGWQEPGARMACPWQRDWYALMCYSESLIVNKGKKSSIAIVSIADSGNAGNIPIVSNAGSIACDVLYIGRNAGSIVKNSVGIVAMLATFP